jgi:prepilin-type N-terminal cleavage/methylation domain-containing protein
MTIVRGRYPISPRCARLAFTLVELMVVLVIISLLSSLTLAGLGVARGRAKADKTRSTIRKLNEIVVPLYESHLFRRVAIPAGLVSRTAVAQTRLVRQRLLVAQEMPDSWSDVYSLSSLPPNATGPARSYAAHRPVAPTTQYENSECLAMIVLRGGCDPEAAEQFRADELGDIDGDGAAEFQDGWDHPIMFIRWPVGFGSSLQSQNASQQPDPFDPLQVSALVAFPTGAPQRDYATIPLIVSGGADKDYGITTGTAVWTSLLSMPSPPYTLRIGGPIAAGTVIDIKAARDNITNHDLSTR